MLWWPNHLCWRIKFWSNNQKYSRFDTAEDVEWNSDTYVADMHKVYNKFRSPLKILGARMETRSKFHYEDPQRLGVKAQNSVAMATWRPVFVPLRCRMYQSSRRLIPASWPKTQVGFI
jgi:hypothetical protein